MCCCVELSALELAASVFQSLWETRYVGRRSSGAAGTAYQLAGASQVLVYGPVELPKVEAATSHKPEPACDSLMEVPLVKTYRAAVIGCGRRGGYKGKEAMLSPFFLPPITHAPAYLACERTELVACSDVREDAMQELGRWYGVPGERQYTDYRELIEREQPEIVSVATMVEQRAEILVHVAENGARAIYAEKPMATSMSEVDGIVEAVERNGVFFNLGTNRRWHPGYNEIKRVMDSGQLGALRSLVVNSNGPLFAGGSHSLDSMMRLNSDVPASWVQAHLSGGTLEAYTDGGDFTGIDGDRVLDDPTGHGIIRFENGVIGYALLAGRGGEIEATCENGVVTLSESNVEWQLREAGSPDRLGNVALMPPKSSAIQPVSTTVATIEDLVHSLDTGEPPRGGARAARASTELIFAFMESHRRDGARVELPLKDCLLSLQRSQASLAKDSAFRDAATARYPSGSSADSTE